MSTIRLRFAALALATILGATRESRAAEPASEGTELFQRG
jgi:hypothetical protein